MPGTTKWCLIALVGMVTFLQAGQGAASVAFPLLKIPYAADHVGMGGAAIAVPAGVQGIWSNPSGAAFASGFTGAAGYRSIVAGMWGGYAAAGLTVSPAGNLSLFVVNNSAGTVEGVDENNRSTGVTWRANTVAGTVAWSRIVYPNLGVGVALKGVYDMIGGGDERYEASGLMLDLGVQYRLFKNRLILGAVAQNMGGMLTSFVPGETWPLPLSIGAGVSFVPRYMHNVRFAVDLEQRRGEPLLIEPGIAVALVNDLLTLRAGFPLSSSELEHLGRTMQGTDNESYQKQDWRLLCLGLGVQPEIGDFALAFDAAVEFHVEMAASVAASVSLGF